MNRKWSPLAYLALVVISLVGLAFLASAGTAPVARARWEASVAPDASLPAFLAYDTASSAFYSLSGELEGRFAPDRVTLTTPQAQLRLRLVGANPQARPVESDAVRSVAHYYLGNDPAAWRENVPLYRQATYQDVYPGVHVTYRADGRTLTSRFFIEPGAALDALRLEFDGASSLTLDRNGNLTINVAGGERLLARVQTAYQETGGRSTSADVRLRRVDRRTYGFGIRGRRDPLAPLVFEVSLLYATHLGGSARDEGWAVAVDGQGNTCVTGITHSDDFPRTAVAHLSAGAETEVFITCFDADGRLVFATYFGGSSSEEGNSIAVDRYGNVYVAGETFSPDFPVYKAWQPNFGGDEDSYALKLNADGTLAYSTFLGGSESEEINDIAVDAAGNVYVGGEVYSDDFPLLNPWQSQTYGDDDEDAFISILDPDGMLVYSTYVGAAQRDQIFRLAVDDKGYVYAAGMTSSATFPLVHPLQSTYGGDWDDCIVLKLNPWTNEMVYSTFLGGAGRDECWGIAIDAQGDAVVAGYTASADFPRVNAFQPSYGGEGDAFVARLAAQGDHLLYSTFLGGSGGERAWDLALDDDGNAYIVGETSSAQNFPRVGALQPTYGGGETDGFLVRLDGQGVLRYGSFVGGQNADKAWGVAVDQNRRVHITGNTWSWDLPVESSVMPYRGYSDAFVARLALVPTPTPFASASIGPQGGAVWLALPGRLTMLTVPSGAVTSTTVFTVAYDGHSDLQGDLQGFRHFFSLKAGHSTLGPVTLNQPLQVILGFADSGATISGTVGLYRLAASAWVTDGITVTERSPNHLIAQVEGTGVYGLLGRANRIYMPLVLRRW